MTPSSITTVNVSRFPAQLVFNEDITLAVAARGEFMKVAAGMEYYGLPIDTEIYEALRRHIPAVWRHFVVKLDQYGLYEDGSFRHARFDQLVQTLNVPWPRTKQGNLRTDGRTWEDMAEICSETVGNYAHLRHIASWLRGELDLLVGRDGRSRPVTLPYLQKAGRTSPSGSFIFALPKWLRGLLKPSPGQLLFYADYAQQEPGLAGFLSGDAGLQRCYHSGRGSFYIALMIECGAAPKDATKKSHPQVHQAGKVLLLAISYGAGSKFVAGRLGVGLAEGDAILRRLKRAFPVFFQWREEVLLKARWQGYIETPDGWRQAVDSQTNPRSLYNFPMQGSGASMTRCAAILASKAGLRVLATVHDALVCEAEACGYEPGDAESGDEAVPGSYTVKGNSTRSLTGWKVPLSVREPAPWLAAVRWAPPTWLRSRRWALQLGAGLKTSPGSVLRR